MKTNTFISLSLFVLIALSHNACKKDSSSVMKFSKSSLIAYYSFNGNANDASVNAYNGIVHGAVLSEGRNNETDGAYLFDGYSNYIELPSAMALNTDSCFSIEAWINNTSITSDGKYTDNLIYGQSDGQYGSDIPLVALEINNNLTVRGVIRGTQNPILDIHSQGPIENGGWDHIVMVRNCFENSLAIYINGALACKNDTILEGNTLSNDFVAIGALYDDQETIYHYFCGKIDMVRIWNIALTQAEIKALKNEDFEIE